MFGCKSVFVMSKSVREDPIKDMMIPVRVGIYGIFQHYFNPILLYKRLQLNATVK